MNGKEFKMIHFHETKASEKKKEFVTTKPLTFRYLLIIKKVNIKKDLNFIYFFLKLLIL